MATSSFPSPALPAQFRRGHHAVRRDTPSVRYPVGRHTRARHYAPVVGRERVILRLCAGAAIAAVVLLIGWGPGLDAALWPALAASAAAAGRPGRSAANLIHAEPHPLARRWVTLNLAHEGLDPVPTKTFLVEDWADRVLGQPWGHANGNAAAMKYALRVGFGGLTPDDEVVYGKDERGLGHLIHVSELGDVAPEVQA